MYPRNYAKQSPPLPLSRSPLPAVDIGGFFRMVQQALALHIKTEGPPENINPILVEDFPRERLTKQDDSFDIITFRVKSATMAPSTNSNIIPKRPSLRDARASKHRGPDYTEKIYGWWELVRPEFTIWSRSNSNADDMAEWFHIFLIKYAFFTKYFAGRGIENFVFMERNDEDIDHNEGQEIYKRRLLYEFRLNRLVTTESRAITNVGVSFGIGTGKEITNINLTSNT